MDKPLQLKDLREYMVEYFKNAPLRRVEVKEPVKLPHLTFPEVTGFLRRVDWYLRPLRVLEKLHAPIKGTSWGKKRHAALNARRNRVQWLRNTAAIYGPYAANQARFLTFNLRPLWDALSEEDRKQFPCLLNDLDWRSYFHDVHLPGIELYLLRMPRRKTVEGAPVDILARSQAELATSGTSNNQELRATKLAKAEKVLVLTRLVRPVDASSWTTPRPPKVKQIIHRVSHKLVRMICARRLKLRCEGSENIPERGPFILVANHTSHVDTGVLMTAVGPLASQIHPTAAADYWFRSRFLAWFLQAMLGAIPFDRKCRNIPKAVALPAQILRNGHSLIFYPEGSRSDDGKLQAFRSTLGLIALASGAPILPAYISGACEALPKGETFINEHPVTVKFGKIISVEGYLGMLDAQSVSNVAHIIAKDVHAAVSELGGVPVTPAAEAFELEPLGVE
jgi:1-acyl-sn-glycerol-3-phosphate acyltransferase